MEGTPSAGAGDSVPCCRYRGNQYIPVARCLEQEPRHLGDLEKVAAVVGAAVRCHVDGHAHVFESADEILEIAGFLKALDTN
jgi:hypothetical protein